MCELSEEEKEAIERLDYFESDDLIEYAMYRACVETIKNLIDNQQKEIEDLKYKVREHICIEAHEQVKKLYISKDKIKEIIEGDYTDLGIIIEIRKLIEE